MTTKDVGDRVGVRYLAYASGTPSTATVVLTVTDPSGNATTPAVSYTAPNQYDASFLLDEAGLWRWRWDVTGLVEDVEHGQVLAADPAPPVYSSLALLRKALNLAATDTTKDDLLQQALVGASRSVEQHCDDRRFYVALTSSARVFSTAKRVLCTDDGYRLLVDDIATSTITVEVGDGTTYTTVTGVEAYPDNALARGWPITALVSPTLDWRAYRKVRVTAVWGWPAVPAAVDQATLLQASRLYRRKDSPEGVAGSSEWGLVRVPNLDPDVKALLAPFTSGFLAR